MAIIAMIGYMIQSSGLTAALYVLGLALAFVIKFRTDDKTAGIYMSKNATSATGWAV